MAAAENTSHNKTQNEPATAGLIIIGDEILKGHTRDTNSYFLLTKLWSLGVKVKAVVVIPDDVDEIAANVRDFSSRYTYVLTSGGIGPTHDDLTLLGVAEAFNEPLVYNEKLAQIVSTVYGVEDLNSFHLKMTKVPQSSKLLFANDDQQIENCFPLICVRNVHIFPGVPTYLQKLFHSFSRVFSSNNVCFSLEKLYLSVDESIVAQQLQEIHDLYGHRVNLGSYPEVDNDEYQTKLLLESLYPDALVTAVKHLYKILPANIVVKTESSKSKSIKAASYHDLPVCQSQIKFSTIYSLLSVNEDSKLSSCVKGSWAVIQEALDKYSLEELCISFNGGKDCTALLHIYCAAIKKKYPSHVDELTALYIEVDSPFSEAQDFINECGSMYNLNIIKIEGKIKEGLEYLKKSHPNIKAILMGTRKCDPYTDQLNLFSPTDQGWPSYMRINPILNWKYSDVWNILRSCHIPYLSLYDQGYTSIGGTHNTLPNPLLKLDDGTYKPAYMLTDESKERAARH